MIQGLLLKQFEINQDRTWDAILIIADKNDPTLPTTDGFVLDEPPPLIPKATPNPLPDHLQPVK